MPKHVEVVEGTTDLLAFTSRMEGRARIVIIDAIADGNPPGVLQIFEETLPPDAAPRHAHELSVVNAIRLLRSALGAPITLITVLIGPARAAMELSPELAGLLDGLVDGTLALIQDTTVL